MEEKNTQLNEALEKMKLEHQQEMEKILDTIFESCKRKVQDALLHLADPSYLGNQATTVEYTLSAAEKVQTDANDFTAAFLKFLKNMGSQSDTIHDATSLAAAIEHLLDNTKGAVRLAGDDDTADKMISTANLAGKAALDYFNTVHSRRLGTFDEQHRPSVVNDCNDKLHMNVQDVVKVLETLVPRELQDVDNRDFADLVEKELLAAAKAIEDAAGRLQTIITQPKPKVPMMEVSVHNAILDSAMAITQAIANLIRAAIASQREIVAQGKGAGTASQFYKKNHRWTEGLISAAKAVALATCNLVEVADNVVQGKRTFEELIVASKEVAAATAQLVTAARVKSVRGSKALESLETASLAIGEAVKTLLRSANQVVEARYKEQAESIDFSQLSLHEYKKREMEQQVQILSFEKKLTDARRKLADMRRATYQQSDYLTN